MGGRIRLSAWGVKMKKICWLVCLFFSAPLFALPDGMQYRVSFKGELKKAEIGAKDFVKQNSEASLIHGSYLNGNLTFEILTKEKGKGIQFVGSLIKDDPEKFISVIKLKWLSFLDGRESPNVIVEGECLLEGDAKKQSTITCKAKAAENYNFIFVSNGAAIVDYAAGYEPHDPEWIVQQALRDFFPLYKEQGIEGMQKYLENSCYPGAESTKHSPVLLKCVSMDYMAAYMDAIVVAATKMPEDDYFNQDAFWNRMAAKVTDFQKKHNVEIPNFVVEATLALAKQEFTKAISEK
jgi:hypothetical protein